MKTAILLVALAVATTVWAQDQKKAEAKPAAQDARPAAQEATPAAQEKKKARPAQMAKKPSAGRFQGARHCLEKSSNTEIIKCAEAYL